MSEKESVNYVKGILSELGIEGKPTLAKCAEIKNQREREQELAELQSNPIFTTKLRREQKKSPQASSSETDSFLKHLSCIADSD